jgi:hypothetical protein
MTGNLLTCGDLFNPATNQAPAAVSGIVGFTGSTATMSIISPGATSNTYQAPICETLVVLVQLSSGTGTFFLNTGSTATNCQQVATTGSVSGTTMQVMVFNMPGNSTPAGANSSTVPVPGTPTQPFFNVSCTTSANVIVSNIGILALGQFPLGQTTPGTGADFVSCRAGINACASLTENVNDNTASAPIGVGSGVFSLAANATNG